MSSSPSVESSDEVLLRSLRKYYADPEALRVLTDVLRKRAKVSLRTLDWFMTNYAKKHNVVFVHNNKDVNVYIKYQGCLDAFCKKSFDPFQRKDKHKDVEVEIVDSDGLPLATTIGQLNFFRFAISNGIVDYVLAHAKDIEAEMLKTHKQRAASRNPKRQQLSKAAIKSLTTSNLKVTVSFS